MASIGAQNMTSTTLQPLPKDLIPGLMVVSVMGSTSVLSAAILLCFLTYVLLKYARSHAIFDTRNQIAVLIYNLVFADMLQGTAFALNTYWLCKNAIKVPSNFCFIQGLFVSTGDLASGVFILAIALHTFATAVYHCRMSGAYFGLFILGCWGFIIAMSSFGIAMHGDDLYQRAGAWCWIAQTFSKERLYLHYLWIFGIEVATIILYVVVFIVLRSRAKASLNNLRPYGITNRSMAQRTLVAAKMMLVYPLAYVILTLPLAAGRMASMAGKEPPLIYYCVAGSMMASCGWVDVIIYTYTRHLFEYYHDTRTAFTNSGVSRSEHGSGTTLVAQQSPMGGDNSEISLIDMLGPRVDRDGNVLTTRPGVVATTGQSSNGPADNGARDRRMNIITTPRYVYGFGFYRTPNRQ